MNFRIECLLPVLILFAATTASANPSTSELATLSRDLNKEANYFVNLGPKREIANGVLVLGKPLQIGDSTYIRSIGYVSDKANAKSDISALVRCDAEPSSLHVAADDLKRRFGVPAFEEVISDRSDDRSAYTTDFHAIAWENDGIFVTYVAGFIGSKAFPQTIQFFLTTTPLFKMLGPNDLIELTKDLASRVLESVENSPLSFPCRLRIENRRTATGNDLAAITASGRFSSDDFLRFPAYTLVLNEDMPSDVRSGSFRENESYAWLSLDDIALRQLPDQQLRAKVMFERLRSSGTKILRSFELQPIKLSNSDGESRAMLSWLSSRFGSPDQKKFYKAPNSRFPNGSYIFRWKDKLREITFSYGMECEKAPCNGQPTPFRWRMVAYGTLR